MREGGGLGSGVVSGVIARDLERQKLEYVHIYSVFR